MNIKLSKKTITFYVANNIPVFFCIMSTTEVTREKSFRFKCKVIFIKISFKF